MLDKLYEFTGNINENLNENTDRKPTVIDERIIDRIESLYDIRIRDLLEINPYDEKRTEKVVISNIDRNSAISA